MVTNDSAINRVGEMVEVELDNAEEYAIFSKNGKALPCQVTYDGKLIFQATVDANASESYILRKGERIDIDTIATGKVYPAWFDDFGWENDKVAFRTYSEKMGEGGGSVLSGYDIFTKRYKYPVLDALYGANFDKEYKRIIAELKAEGKPAGIAGALSYHVDHGFGMDYYVVGPTLGSGTAALVIDGEINYPGFYDNVKFLDKGGLRLTFQLSYDPVDIDGEMVQEVRTITLDKGTHFNHIEVEYKNLSKPTDLAIGLVMHDDGETSRCGDGYIAYAEPKHQYGWHTYNAVIYPEESQNRRQYFDEPIGAAQGHILSEGRYTPGEKFSYYMGAGWNRWGFETPNDWFDYVESMAKVLEKPLICKIK